MLADEHQTCKLIVVGDAGVGKSSLQDRWVHGQFHYHRPCMNINVEFSTKSLSVRQRDVRFQLWDTAGQERYTQMNSLYFRGARAALVAYDITSSTSFDSLEEWLKQVEHGSDEEIVVALVGCKSDLHAGRQVDTESALALAERYGCMHIETSAKTGVNVDALFESIACDICYPDGSQGRPFARCSVLSLELNEESPLKPQSATVSARSLSGEIVAQVDVDLHSDTIIVLKHKIARQSQAKLAKRLSLVFGTVCLDVFSGDTKLAICLESCGWQSNPASWSVRHCVVS